MRRKLTKSVVEGIAPTDQAVLVWDTVVAGFAVKVSPSGKRTYLLKFRDPLRRQRKPTIGVHGIITCEQARDHAKRLLAQVSMGDDPLAKRRALLVSPTFGEFSERFLADYAAKRLKPRSYAECQRLLTNILLPRLGHLRILEIDKTHIAKLHRELDGTKPQANRVLSTVSKMIAVANDWGLRSDPVNPSRSVKKYPETARTRFLADDEIRRLFDTLDDPAFAESPFAVFVRLAIFTGCRKSELLNARLDDLDLEGRSLRLRDSKTGARTVFLNDSALEAIGASPRHEGQEYLILGRNSARPAVGVQKWWARFRKAAKLPDVRIHDLRHTFASIGAGRGQSLLQIGALLGHKTPQTTMRYAHHYEDALRSSSNAIDQGIRKTLLRDVSSKP
jgi:integrase